jgi:hypothetical protein
MAANSEPASVDLAYHRKMAELFLSEQNWGLVSVMALVSIYKRTGIDFVLKIMEEPRFKEWTELSLDAPGMRIYRLLKELEKEALEELGGGKSHAELEVITTRAKANITQVKKKAEELGIKIVVYDGGF